MDESGIRLSFVRDTFNGKDFSNFIKGGNFLEKVPNILEGIITLPWLPWWPFPVDPFVPNDPNGYKPDNSNRKDNSSNKTIELCADCERSRGNSKLFDQEFERIPDFNRDFYDPNLGSKND